MLISLLIPTIKRHQKPFMELARFLYSQTRGNPLIEIIYDKNELTTTGAKRNSLLKAASGKYVAFIDADDRVPGYYVKELLNAAKSDADCFAINGTITTNGKNQRKWFISKDFPYKDSVDINGNKIYLRYPNHICPIKREIAIQVPFPNRTRGEDYAWASELHQRGLIKTEHKIIPPMYFYLYIAKKISNIKHELLAK